MSVKSEIEKKEFEHFVKANMENYEEELENKRQEEIECASDMWIHQAEFENGEQEWEEEVWVVETTPREIYETFESQDEADKFVKTLNKRKYVNISVRVITR